jgi:hypothetical protein
VLIEQSAQRARAKAEEMKRREGRRCVDDPIAPPQFLIKIADAKVKPFLVRHVNEESAACAQDARYLAYGLVRVIEMLKHRPEDDDIKRGFSEAATLDGLALNLRSRITSGVFGKAARRLYARHSPARLHRFAQQIAAPRPYVQEAAASSC